MTFSSINSLESFTAITHRSRSFSPFVYSRLYSSLFFAQMLLFLSVAASFASFASSQTLPVNGETVATRACIPDGPFASLPYCDASLSIDERVADLVNRLWQNASFWVPPQLTARHGGGDSPGPSSNVSAIGLPEFNWGANCAHVSSILLLSLLSSALLPF